MEILDLIEQEKNRQANSLELIASENYVSENVLRAMGSVTTNKYSEGYPGRRYYGGNEIIDEIEQNAIDAAKKLFNADHANVQPHSGANANMAVYNAWCEPGDTILGLALDQGGHLTHGSPVTQSAKIYHFVPYHVDRQTFLIDYDEIEKLAAEHKPKIILAGFSAYSRDVDWARIAKIAHENGAIAMADIAHIAGLIAGKQIANPLKNGFDVMTTTTQKTLRGPHGGLILSMGKVSDPIKKIEKTLENLPTLIDKSVFPGTQGGPLNNMIAGKAIALNEALQPEFTNYAKQVILNARKLSDELKARGYEIITGGTDNHLLLIDMQKSKQISGKEAERILEKVGLSINANAIPYDTADKFNPSGLRIGTPAITTRGMGENEMIELAQIIDEAISNREDTQKLDELKNHVILLANNFMI